MGDSGVTESFLADLETNGRIEYNSTIGRIFISTALLSTFFLCFQFCQHFKIQRFLFRLFLNLPKLYLVSYYCSLNRRFSCGNNLKCRII